MTGLMLPCRCCVLQLSEEFNVAVVITNQVCLCFAILHAFAAVPNPRLPGLQDSQLAHAPAVVGCVAQYNPVGVQG